MHCIAQKVKTYKTGQQQVLFRAENEFKAPSPRPRHFGVRRGRIMQSDKNTLAAAMLDQVRGIILGLGVLTPEICRMGQSVF